VHQFLRLFVQHLLRFAGAIVHKLLTLVSIKNEGDSTVSPDSESETESATPWQSRHVFRSDMAWMWSWLLDIGMTFHGHQSLAIFL